MDTTILNNYLQIVSSLVTILGLPLALYLFYNDKRRERREREYGTYNALDDKYIHFLELCLERPELNVVEYSNESHSNKNDKQEQILLLILISILERAFLMYYDQSTKIKERQWLGWQEYMKDYCRKENFRRRWPELGIQFDNQFVAFMNSLMDRENVD